MENVYIINNEDQYKVVEDIIKATMKLMEHRKKHISLDVYFNDLDNTFVVKIHRYGIDLKEQKHFRNEKLQDSLIQAYDFCKNNL